MPEFLAAEFLVLFNCGLSGAPPPPNAMILPPDRFGSPGFGPGFGPAAGRCFWGAFRWDGLS